MMKFFRSDTTATETQEAPAPEVATAEPPAQAAETQQADASEVTLQPAEADDAPTASSTVAEPETASVRDHDFEADLRDVVRRDVIRWRKTRSSAGSTPTDNVSSLVQRVAGQSVREIDNVIGELEVVRDLLRQEGERLRRDLNGYASMNQAAMSSMKIISESMAQWRSTLGNMRRAGV